MENIGIGFCKGFGGLFGVVIGLLIIAVIVRVFMFLREKWISIKEMPGILLEYRKVLKKHELYEQLAVINKYKNELKNNQLPKELSELYTLKIYHYVDVEPYEDKYGVRMWIGTNRILIYNGPAKPKITNNNSEQQQPKSDTENRPNNNQDTNDIS